MVRYVLANFKQIEISVEESKYYLTPLQCYFLLFHGFHHSILKQSLFTYYADYVPELPLIQQI